MSKEAFIGTGTLLACMIDMTRLYVYGFSLLRNQKDVGEGVQISMSYPYELPLLISTCVSAFAGAWWGRFYLQKVTQTRIQKFVLIALTMMGMAMLLGWV